MLTGRRVIVCVHLLKIGTGGNFYPDISEGNPNHSGGPWKRNQGSKDQCGEEVSCSFVLFQFSSSVVSDSVTYGLQNTRLPCPSPTPGTCSNSSPSSQ